MQVTLFGVGVFYKWATARGEYERAVLSGWIIVYEGVSKRVSIKKVDLRKKMPSDVKQSCRFVKAIEVENKEYQTAEDKRRKGR